MVYGLETYYKREYLKLIDPEYDKKWERFVALNEIVLKYYGKATYIEHGGSDIWVTPGCDSISINYPSDDTSIEDFEILIGMRSL